jgi:signal peptidase I
MCAGLVAAATLAIGWLVFAPVAIGGPASYVVTDGTSMLPHFRANGLVLTRSEPTYHVGEVAAYHSHTLHAVVMHRIVGIDGDRYVFEGDNNDFRDSYRPTKSQIIGKEWLYVPHAGSALTFIRTPTTFAIVFGLLGIFGARAYLPVQNKRRRRRHGHAH